MDDEIDEEGCIKSGRKFEVLKPHNLLSSLPSRERSVPLKIKLLLTPNQRFAAHI